MQFGWIDVVQIRRYVVSLEWTGDTILMVPVVGCPHDNYHFLFLNNLFSFVLPLFRNSNIHKIDDNYKNLLAPLSTMFWPKMFSEEHRYANFTDQLLIKNIGIHGCILPPL